MDPLRSIVREAHVFDREAFEVAAVARAPLAPLVDEVGALRVAVLGALRDA